MTASALDRLCAALGVEWAYHDGAGRWCEAPRESRMAACKALGWPAGTEAEAAEALACVEASAAARVLPQWWVAEPDHAPGLGCPGPWQLLLEDGTTRQGAAADPLPALPAGLHRLHCGGSDCALIVAPPRLDLPARGWGLTAPLYGLWDGACAGLGSYGLLGGLARDMGGLGASFVGVNPVHAGFPTAPDDFSPYAPSHRERLNILHVAVPGAADPPPDPGDGALIDHGREIPAIMAALEAAHARFLESGPRPAFESWRRAGGTDLDDFATHQALSEHFGPYWRDWPAAFRDPRAPEVAGLARRKDARRIFHLWAQWEAERQLAAAARAARDGGMDHGLYLDLAVGTHIAGAETWADPSRFAAGVLLGAPPDDFAPAGQLWNLAPLAPGALISSGFRPLARILAAQMAHAGLVRVDHILGFERAFWVPPGLPGVYVRMPRDAMLAVARLQAWRAGALIVGEDLGAIPPGLRQALGASGILGCRIAMFERDHSGAYRPPHAYEPTAMAAFSSHDLPTWRGWRAGRDIDWRARLGEVGPDAARAARAARQAACAAFDAAMAAAAPAAATMDADAAAMHRFLGQTGSLLVAVQAEDVFDCTEQANLPGTVHAHPNWRRRLPVPASCMASDARMAALARTMAAAGR